VQRRKQVVDKKVTRKWRVTVVAYFILAVLVLLGFIGVAASYFVNRSGAETILPTPTSFVVNILVGALVIVVVLPFISRFMKKRVKIEKKVVAEVKKEVVEKKVAKKVVKGRKKFSDWMLVTSVIVIVVIAVALFELLRAGTFPVLNDFFLLYYPYMLAGLVVLVVLIVVLVSLEKRKKKK